jgi:hypothetical protein
MKCAFDSCKNEIEGRGNICHECKCSFCDEHTLPENHQCPHTPLLVIKSLKHENKPKKYIRHSEYETKPKIQSFDYIFRGNRGKIKSELFEGIYNKLKRENSGFSEDLFKSYIQYQDNKLQYPYLIDLIENIQTITTVKDNQARIAISFVQNIRYDYEKMKTLKSYPESQFNYRYPYEVLYDNYGICIEKSLLLSFILRSLGFGVAIIIFGKQEHAAVGIKAPEEYCFPRRDVKSHYAFVETTRPSIITDYSKTFENTGVLTLNPQVFEISDGDTFVSISEEYKDSRKCEHYLLSKNSLTNSEKLELNRLFVKYGL